LKHSLDKTGRELLFVPVPLPKKKRVKVFIDIFVDQGAQGLSGVLLLLLATGLDIGVQMLSLVTLVLIAGWGVLAYRARRSYVDHHGDRIQDQAKVLAGFLRVLLGLNQFSLPLLQFSDVSDHSIMVLDVPLLVEDTSGS
jgi:hypothetical protein